MLRALNLVGGIAKRISYFAPASFRQISSEIPANFHSQIFPRMFRPCFSRVSGHPKNSRPKFMAKIVGIPLQFHFVESKNVSRRYSAYWGDQSIQRNRHLKSTTSQKVPLEMAGFHLPHACSVNACPDRSSRC